MQTFDDPQADIHAYHIMIRELQDSYIALLLMKALHGLRPVEV